ncbi:hypothetical protein [Alicyclobacillus shizuokensis]|uniref:hypothetical protein n=1 Tax=Alicyclobacillus shizuokensis TaxID=392014 RepID=UPI00082D1F51|nr:hypothetical protein [Alicyclobacillus shizuokensis]
MGNFVYVKKPAPVGNLYQRPEIHTEYQIFSEDYFSYADVNIYFGDIWVDEATSFSFVLQEEVLPIYGYHSYTFDTIARGRRIVSGTFSINFKQTGYLQAILENALAIQYAVDQAKQNGKIPQDYFSKHTLDEFLQENDYESFDQLATQFEDALWGTAPDKNNLLSPLDGPYFRSDAFGFDIKINYGAVSEAMDPNRKPYFTAIRHAPKANITVETVNGVQIVSYQKEMSTAQEGMPIQEVYSFVARDVNGPLYVR